MAFGLSHFSAWRFFYLNALGALFWATVMTLAGYAFGHAFEMVLDDVKRYEFWIIGLILLCAGGVWLYQYLYRKQQNRG
jgi:membrane protein DedA with SNARE-associated domain